MYILFFVRQLKSYNGVSYEYDGSGRRTKKGTITFAYDGQGNIITQSNGLEFLYDALGVIGVKYGGNHYFYRKDIQGNIIALLDSTGKLVVEYVYDAWGNHAMLDANGNDITSATHIGNLNPYRYRGYYYDTETGLYYLQSRYYDPEICRFMTIDGIEYVDPQDPLHGRNLYAYCGNNPVMNVDPTGHFFLACVLIGMFAGAVLIGTASGLAAAQNGANGWGIFGNVLLGIGIGALLGAFIGAGIGLIGTGASMIGGAFALAGGGSLSLGAVGVGVGAIVVGGAIVREGVIGLSYILSQWHPGDWPGDDPTNPPGDGFIWRGPGEVGSPYGEWYNPATGDQLHPDLNHKPPKGPHWGWRNKLLRIFKDIFKIGGF